MASARAMDGLFIDRDLMPQRKVFRAERRMGPEERDDKSQQGRDDGWHRQGPSPCGT